MLPKIYLRKEPTTDPEANRPDFKRTKVRYDVVAYLKEGGAALGRWRWFYRAKPTRRNKRVTINGTRHTIVWLPDA